MTKKSTYPQVGANKIGILYEHPQWHEPLFDALDKRGIDYIKIDLKDGAFSIYDIPEAAVYYNLVSPSAYKRGNQRAVPFAYALCTHLERQGKTVLNGSASMHLELSKSAQMGLLDELGIHHPKSLVFNSVEALRRYEDRIEFPQIIKPEQGGSGSRMYKVNSVDEVAEIFEADPSLWLPDYLFLIQDEIHYDKDFGIIRMEFVGGELVYAMRVITNGSFNICPSTVCNPENPNEASACSIPTNTPPQFLVYDEISDEAIAEAKRIIKASGHQVASVEFAINADGNRYFYDINSNSNLRANISEAFGSGDPFERVVDYLESYLVGELV